MAPRTDLPVAAAAAASMAILLLTEQYNSSIEDAFIANYINPTIRRGQINRHYAKHREPRPRKSWARLKRVMTDRQFRRYFRMSKDMYQMLCNDIEDIIGAEEFKSEDFLNTMLTTPRVGSANNIYVAHENSTGGMISGEIKLAITLRILGGGSYMDIAMFYEASFNHAHKIFKHVVEDWLCHPSFYPINGIEYCSDDDRMREVALQFSTASNNVINGCIGALDGWVVKVQRPAERDGVPDPTSFYSRKGFYAINVQAIVDKRKRVLFRSIMSRGAEHDSTAFKKSSLYKWLSSNWRSMVEKGYFFIGDSAYSLKSFLLTPYDNALHDTPEDNYNFFHSSSQISVECCFGEIDLRFGIFWKPLKFSLDMNCNIIDACMRMHNFIVKNRNREEGIGMDPVDKDVFNDDARRFFAVHPDDNEGVYGGEEDARRDENGNVQRGGRPQRYEVSSTETGKMWRDRHRNEIAILGLERPRSNWFRERNRMVGDW